MAELISSCVTVQECARFLEKEKGLRYQKDTQKKKTARENKQDDFRRDMALDMTLLSSCKQSIFALPQNTDFDEVWYSCTHRKNQSTHSGRTKSEHGKDMATLASVATQFPLPRPWVLWEMVAEICTVARKKTNVSGPQQTHHALTSNTTLSRAADTVDDPTRNAHDSKLNRIMDIESGNCCSPSIAYPIYSV